MIHEVMNHPLCTCFCCLLLSVSLASAEDFTWTGGGLNDEWNNPANWDKGSIPDNSEDVINFDSNLTSDLTITVDTQFLFPPKTYYDFGEMKFNGVAHDITFVGNPTVPSPFTLSFRRNLELDVFGNSGDIRFQTPVNIYSDEFEKLVISIDSSTTGSLNFENVLYGLDTNYNQQPMGLQIYNQSSDQALVFSGVSELTGEIELVVGTVKLSGTAKNPLGTGDIAFNNQNDSTDVKLLVTNNVTLNNHLVITDGAGEKTIEIASGKTFNYEGEKINNTTSNAETLGLTSDVVNGVGGTIEFTNNALVSDGKTVLNVGSDTILSLNPGSAGTQNINGAILGFGTLQMSGEGIANVAKLSDISLTQVNSGTLNVTGADSGVALETIEVNGGTLNFTADFLSLNKLDVNSGTANLGGSSGTIQTLNLNGGTTTNTAVGTIVNQVNVNGVTLTVNGGLLVNTQLNLDADSTLAGDGEVQADDASKLVLDGEIAPGNSIGALAIEASGAPTNFDLDLSSAEFTFELGANGSSDQLVSGTFNFDLGDAFSIEQFEFVTVAGFAPGNTYDLFYLDNADILGTIVQDTGNVGGYLSTIEVTTVDFDDVLRLTVSNTPIPEPTSGILLLGGLGLLLFRRSKV